MSNTALTWAYRQKTGKGAGCKAVLIALADFADQEGSCFPGQELLGQMTEQNVRTVRNHVQTLIEAGLISRERRMKDGLRTSDRYYLLMDSTRELPETAAGSSLPATGAGLPADFAGLPAAAAGYPSEEPSDEPLGNAREAKPEKPTPRQLDEEFARWYETYPRKNGKEAARRKFHQVRLRGTSLETLERGARAYAADPNREPEFTKHASTWLHQGCWDDDPLPERAQPRTENLVLVSRPQW